MAQLWSLGSMFAPPFRILFCTLIGWTLLLFIYPLIAMSLMVIGLGVAIICLARQGVRDGIIQGGKGSANFSFEREKQPLMFRVVILLQVIFGVSIIVGVIFGVIHDSKDMFSHYWF